MDGPFIQGRGMLLSSIRLHQMEQPLVKETVYNLKTFQKVHTLAPNYRCFLKALYYFSISISCKITWCFPQGKFSINVYLIFQGILRILSWRRHWESHSSEPPTLKARKVRGSAVRFLPRFCGWKWQNPKCRDFFS